MKAIYIVVALAIVLGAGAFLFFSNQQPYTPSPTPQTVSKEPVSNTQIVFENPKKSAHYESNTPAHGVVLAGLPINVVIDFNFDLAKTSSIKIQKDDKDYGVGETLIDASKLAMRRGMDTNSPDGQYSVIYNACWPDGSCHDGNFQFAIDKSLSEGFVDMTSKKEVEIKMTNIAFNPKDIKVSKGAKITWVNDDEVEHYVDTDSHPAHTYYKEQNSKSLAKGESYSLTFNTLGIYPYHCSAHAEAMSANILVE